MCDMETPVGNAKGNRRGTAAGSKKTQFRKGERVLPKKVLFPESDVNWQLLLDFEWVIDNPRAEPDTAIRKHLKRWLEKDPVDWIKEYGGLIRRLKAPNRAEQKAAEERALDETEEKVTETIQTNVSELKGKMATVATGER
jgi:hypothetical protein